MRVHSVRTHVLGCIALCLFVGVSWGHHSFAMFDRQTDLDVKGVVKEFQLTNPHSYIQLIADQDGKNWTIEAESANGLLRKNWKKNSVLAGDKITAHIHPLRNGAPGGQLMWVRKADGTIMGKSEEK